MILLCRVCAEFHSPDGTLLHRVGMKERLVPHEAPDTIQTDPLFALLVSDGSISAVSSKEEQKKLEQMDPTVGIDASGKRIQSETADPETVTESAGVPGDAAASTATKPETKSIGRARKTGVE